MAAKSLNHIGNGRCPAPPPAVAGSQMEHDVLLAWARTVKDLGSLRAFLTDALRYGDPAGANVGVPEEWRAEALDTACRAVLSLPKASPDLEAALYLVCVAAGRLLESCSTHLLDDCRFIMGREPALICKDDPGRDLHLALATCWVNVLRGRDDAVWRDSIAQFASREMRPEFWSRFYGMGREAMKPESKFAAMLPPEVISYLKGEGVVVPDGDQARPQFAMDASVFVASTTLVGSFPGMHFPEVTAKFPLPRRGQAMLLVTLLQVRNTMCTPNRPVDPHVGQLLAGLFRDESGRKHLSP